MNPSDSPTSAATTQATAPLLESRDLHVRYGAINALNGVSLRVMPGQIVSLIGANGAGKTTLLKTISALHRAKTGDILYNGESIRNLAPHEIVRRGLCHVPEGRMVFANLTVQENLQMGAYLLTDRKVVAQELDYVFTTFPRLKERLHQMSGTLSGGEQQMLAIGRALMGKPRFLMLDEPSLGIAPLLVKAIFEKIVQINREHGITILLVEQNANLALEIAHHAYVMETGVIALKGESRELRANPDVKAAYLGGR
ncbi:MAG: ABC transporter ATP-binding protein [Verrucomicrobia bacterium]|nr:ABC transporter ATP-binding protein [Verrucomicrobiota bacterium]MBI3867034.1 ABC transporter ATP-binding protein [Verrucomicrobiota bacterium]